MRKLLFVLLLLVVGGVGLGFYQGWFNVSTIREPGSRKTEVQLTIDQDKKIGCPEGQGKGRRRSQPGRASLGRQIAWPGELSARSPWSCPCQRRAGQLSGSRAAQ